MKSRRALGLAIASLSLPFVQRSAQSADPNPMSFATVYVAAEYYEYARDGSATLGLVAQRLPNDRVKFVMCDNKVVEVSFNDLRKTKGRCESRPPDRGLWNLSTAELAPVYRYTNDPTSTKVKYQNQVVELKSLKELRGYTIALPPAAKASEPVGYVFKDVDGTKAMVIMRSVVELK